MNAILKQIKRASRPAQHKNKFTLTNRGILMFSSYSVSVMVRS